MFKCLHTATQEQRIKHLRWICIHLEVHLDISGSIWTSGDAGHDAVRQPMLRSQAIAGAFLGSCQGSNWSLSLPVRGTKLPQGTRLEKCHQNSPTKLNKLSWINTRWIDMNSWVISFVVSLFSTYWTCIGLDCLYIALYLPFLMIYLGSCRCKPFDCLQCLQPASIGSSRHHLSPILPGAWLNAQHRRRQRNTLNMWLDGIGWHWMTLDDPGKPAESTESTLDLSTSSHQMQSLLPAQRCHLQDKITTIYNDHKSLSLRWQSIKQFHCDPSMRSISQLQSWQRQSSKSLT